MDQHECCSAPVRGLLNRLSHSWPGAVRRLRRWLLIPLLSLLLFVSQGIAAGPNSSPADATAAVGSYDVAPYGSWVSRP